MTKGIPDPTQLKRSVLYVPGSNERAIEKISTLEADCYIIDLEDAVAPEAKPKARATVCDLLSNKNNSNLIIRINALDTKWGNDDLQAVCDAGAKTVLLPKVETASDIQQCEKATNHIDIWAMIETPLSVINVYEIASSSKRLKCLVMGTADLVNDLRAEHTPERLEVLYSLSRSIIAARADGIDILDSVHLDLADQAGFQQTCDQGRTLGFDGRTLIHPKQIDFANLTYSPSGPEIERAQQVIAIHRQAIQKGEGVAILDGKLIEVLHVENAKRVLNIAKLIDA